MMQHGRGHPGSELSWNMTTDKKGRLKFCGMNRKYFRGHPRTSLAPGIQQPLHATVALWNHAFVGLWCYGISCERSGSKQICVHLQSGASVNDILDWCASIYVCRWFFKKTTSVSRAIIAFVCIPVHLEAHCMAPLIQARRRLTPKISLRPINHGLKTVVSKCWWFLWIATWPSVQINEVSGHAVCVYDIQLKTS